jgi:hypothetical protein
VAQSHHQHHQALVNQFTDQAIVADAIAPQASQRTRERFASVTGIVGFCYKTLQKSSQPLGCREIELAQLTLRPA